MRWARGDSAPAIGGSEKWAGSGCILKGEPTGSDDRWDAGKPGGKEDAQVYGLRVRKIGAATFKARAAVGGAGVGDPCSKPSLFGSRKLKMIPNQSLTKTQTFVQHVAGKTVQSGRADAPAGISRGVKRTAKAKRRMKTEHKASCWRRVARRAPSPRLRALIDQLPHPDVTSSTPQRMRLPICSL